MVMPKIGDIPMAKTKKHLTANEREALRKKAESEKKGESRYHKKPTKAYMPNATATGKVKRS